MNLERPSSQGPTSRTIPRAIFGAESLSMEAIIPQHPSKRCPVPYPIAIGDHAVSSLTSALELLKMLRDDSFCNWTERTFAQHLRPDDLDEIETSTRDVLSDYLANSVRDLKLFQSRVDLTETSELVAKFSALDSEKLAAIAGRCVGLNSQQMRVGQASTQPDAQGRFVQFIPPEQVPRVLNDVCTAWNIESSGEAALLRALWIFVATLNAHAFCDGNGRLARTLLNSYLLRAGVLSRTPLPLGPLIYATRGNFEIAVRRVELMGDWTSLCAAFKSLVLSYVKISGIRGRQTA